MRIFFFCTLLLLGQPISAQVLSPREIAKTLCAPEMHGRGYVNSGDSLAAVFLASQFKAHGIQPLGKQYLQPFRFTVNTFPTEMSLHVNGIVLTPGIDFIVAPESGSMRGKTSATLINTQLLADKDRFVERMDELMAKGKTTVVIDIRNTKADSVQMMRELGSYLLNFCPVILLTTDKLTWSVARKQEAYPMAVIQSAAITDIQEVEWNVEAKLVAHEAYNVIGYVPGKKKKLKKVTAISAHYDHLGRMGKFTYFPGANDNASGTAILFGVAEKWQKQPGKHPLLVMAFAGEEAGLLGSKYYVEHPLLPLQKMSFLLNLDIMGSGEEGITVVNGSVFSDAFDRLVQINQTKQYVKEVKSRGKAANSDHYYFTEAGVPAFFAYTMGPNKNYHDVYDKWEALSFAEFEDLQLLFVEFLRSW